MERNIAVISALDCVIKNVLIYSWRPTNRKPRNNFSSIGYGVLRISLLSALAKLKSSLHWFLKSRTAHIVAVTVPDEQSTSISKEHVFVNQYRKWFAIRQQQLAEKV